MKKQKIAVAAMSLAATMMLSACGDGGNIATPSTGASAPAAMTSNGALEASVVAQLNAYRLAMGVGPVAQDEILDTSAQAHSLYLFANFVNGNLPAQTNNEVSNFANYYEATPLSRARKAGAPATEFIDEVADVGFTLLNTRTFASDCVTQALSTVYRLQSMTYVQQTIGVGLQQNVSQRTYACVFDFGQSSGVVGSPIADGFSPVGGQQISVDAVAHSPFTNETGVAQGMTRENPNPAPGVSAPGRPIMVRVTATQAGDILTVSTFTLTSPSGLVVPTRIIVASAALSGSTGATADVNNMLEAGVAFLLPLDPLAANTTYTVSFAGARGSTPINATWSFTTAAN